MKIALEYALRGRHKRIITYDYDTMLAIEGDGPPLPFRHNIESEAVSADLGGGEVITTLFSSVFPPERGDRVNFITNFGEKGDARVREIEP